MRRLNHPCKFTVLDGHGDFQYYVCELVDNEPYNLVYNAIFFDDDRNRFICGEHTYTINGIYYLTAYDNIEMNDLMEVRCKTTNIPVLE